MDINITITHKLSPTIEDSITKFIAAALVAAAAETPAAKPRGRAAAAAPAAPAAPVAESPGIPMPGIPMPSAATPAPTAAAGRALTLDDMTALVSSAMPRIGVDSMRTIFKQFNTSRLQDTPPAQFPALAAAIQSALGMVGG